MTRVVAFANEKGGSAKTTTAVCVAGCLVELGESVLLVDLDPQAAATRWLGAQPARGLGDVFGGGEDDLSRYAVEGAAGVDLVPADERLAAADKLLDPDEARLGFLRALERLPAGRWSWVLLDTPPNLGTLTVAATIAADAVVVPTSATSLDLAGVARVQRRVQQLAELYRREVGVAAYVPCRVKTGTALGTDVLEMMHDRYGEAVTPPVRDTVKLAEAPGFHQPIHTYAPSHPAADDYRAVTEAVVKLAGGR